MTHEGVGRWPEKKETCSSPGCREPTPPVPPVLLSGGKLEEGDVNSETLTPISLATPTSLFSPRANSFLPQLTGLPAPLTVCAYCLCVWGSTHLWGQRLRHQPLESCLLPCVHCYKNGKRLCFLTTRSRKICDIFPVSVYKLTSVFGELRPTPLCRCAIIYAIKPLLIKMWAVFRFGSYTRVAINTQHAYLCALG